jgi:hypothetical protein
VSHVNDTYTSVYDHIYHTNWTGVHVAAEGDDNRLVDPITEVVQAVPPYYVHVAIVFIITVMLYVLLILVVYLLLHLLQLLQRL